jgi:hypothetical protein
MHITKNTKTEKTIVFLTAKTLESWLASKRLPSTDHRLEFGHIIATFKGIGKLEHIICKLQDRKADGFSESSDFFVETLYEKGFDWVKNQAWFSESKNDSPQDQLQAQINQMLAAPVNDTPATVNIRQEAAQAKTLLPLRKAFKAMLADLMKHHIDIRKDSRQPARADAIKREMAKACQTPAGATQKEPSMDHNPLENLLP